MIGAELHLDVKTVLWQETTTWQEGSDSVAGNSDVPPAPMFRARGSPFPAGFRVSRSEGSLPDRNLGCSTHQAMSPLVQPGLHTSLLWMLRVCKYGSTPFLDGLTSDCKAILSKFNLLT